MYPSVSTRTVSLLPRRTFSKSRRFSTEGRREYFYYLDLRGRLFHLSPNEVNDPVRLAQLIRVPVHLKEERFLNFFFKRIQENPYNKENPYQQGFHWISICAGEYNYIKAA